MAFNLSSIQRSNAVRAPRVMIYGPHGMGKTTFGAKAPSPIVIQTEDGLGLLDVPHFPLASTYKEVVEAIGALYEEKHDYQTVVLDSVDWLENLINAHVNNNYEAKELAYGKSAIYAADCFREILEGLTALRNDRDMAVILIAHSEIKRFENPETEPYDRYQPKLQARASALVQGAAFYGGFSQATGDDLGLQARRGGRGRRRLRTGERGDRGRRAGDGRQRYDRRRRPGRGGPHRAPAQGPGNRRGIPRIQRVTGQPAA